MCRRFFENVFFDAAAWFGESRSPSERRYTFHARAVCNGVAAAAAGPGCPRPSQIFLERALVHVDLRASHHFANKAYIN